MGFFAPWFLAGIAAVGLPVWLHLLRKHKSPPQPFGSLMFFEQHTQSSIKHRRLRYLLLLALRTALFVLIALAFAHPYIERKSLPFQHTGEITVVAIDNSLSMRAGGLFDQAKQMAKSELSSLRPGERAQVLEFGSRVHSLSEVTDDRQQLNAAIDAAQLSDDKTSFAELSRSLRSIAQSLKLPLRVALYSDMQQTGMPPNFNDLRLNAAIRLEPHPLASKEVPNFAVENVIAPRRVYDGKKQRVLATVASFGAAKATRPRFADPQRPRGRDQIGGRARRADAPPSSFSRSKCLTGATKARLRSIPPTRCPPTTRFIFPSSAAIRGRRYSSMKPAARSRMFYFKAALEASGQSAFDVQSGAGRADRQRQSRQVRVHCHLRRGRAARWI